MTPELITAAFLNNSTISSLTDDVALGQLPQGATPPAILLIL